MRVNNHWVLLLTFILSLPLCCLPLLYIPAAPPFAARFQVSNAGSEPIYITPVGQSGDQSRVLLRVFDRFPYIPLFKKGDLRLAPGETIGITSEANEDLTFTAIAVRDDAGNYRQFPVDQPSVEVARRQDAEFTIGPLESLEPMTPGLLLTAVNSQDRNWLGLSVVVAGLLPPVLLAGWIWAFVRRPKE